MNMRLKSGNDVGASPHTSRWPIQPVALPPIKAMLYLHTYVVSLPIYGIWTAMKYHFNTDNHALACVIVPVKGFGSSDFTNITTHAAGTFYSGC